MRMKIVNVMTSKILGGIEQAFLDYNAALRLKGHQVLAVVSTKTKLRKDLERSGIDTVFLPFSRYNYFLILPLYFKLKKFNPDLIICHTKKSIPIIKTVAWLLGVKIIAVAHNPRFKLIDKCDAVFSITEYQKRLFVDKGLESEKIFVIPNMLTYEKAYKPFSGFRNPPVIGAIGRFDPMKGFPDFIRALALLRQNKIPFQAVLAGSSQPQYPQEDELIRRLIAENNLQNAVYLPGWISDKDDFYGKIDVFVLPSIYEPFGIVLLEAMQYSLPVVASTAEGPSEIFAKQPEAGYLFEKGNYHALANCLEKILHNPDEAAKTAQKGYELCRNVYSLTNVAETLDKCLKQVVGGR